MSGPGERPPIRVLLADDQPLIRSGIRVLLEVEGGFDVCGEAEDGAEAVAMVRSTRPDVVLLDIRMPGADGIGALEEIAADPELRDVAVIVLTAFDLDEYVYRALRAGAAGFLLKDMEPTRLLRAIEQVHTGEALLAPSITRRLIERYAHRPAATRPAVLDALTSREREVLALVGRGCTNGEIARELVISPATARTHVGRLLTKLDARDRVQLVVIAYESGIVVPDAGGRRP